MLPGAMNLHIPAADVAGLLVPRAFIVVFGRIRPFTVDPDRRVAVLARSLVPFSIAFGLARFADLGRMIPFPVDAYRRAAVCAMNVVPFRVLLRLAGLA